MSAMGKALPYGFGNETPMAAAARGPLARIGTRIASKIVSAVAALSIVFSTLPVSTAQAAGETRSLKIHFVHTGERANVVYKRNGRYDPQGLQALNRLLRDWRRNEPTRMDPRLFDLVWEVYRAVGARDYITVVSAYRSPATNEMLRSRSSAVAKNSQHRLGKAMDFYIPGVPLKKLRETAMRFQVGGVGYYPTSGSPFVHLDVGSVRAWPRMNRNELVRLFPDGKTMHIPADGKPLPGYELALAEYKRRAASGGGVMMADAGSARNGAKKRNLLTALFGGGDEDEDAESIVAPAPRPARPQPVQQAAPQRQQQAPMEAAPAEMRSLPGSLVASAPVPAARPAYAGQIAGNGLATALYSPPRSTAQEAIASVLPTERPQTGEKAAAVAPDLQGMAIPVPTLLGERAAGVSPVMTASIAPVSPELMAAVPVPVARPGVGGSVMAEAMPEEDDEDDVAEQEALSADMVAALSASGADARRDFQTALEKAASATVIATRVPVPSSAPAQKPAEVAALEPAAGRFGDVFDTPKPAASGLEAGMPAKGGRPQQADAEKARRAMTSGTAELTGDKLAQWAFAKQRQPGAASGIKAPRITAQALAGFDSESRPQQLQTATREVFEGNSRVLTVNVP